MIKMDKFAISKRPYAVDLNSLTTTWCEATYNGKPVPDPTFPGGWRGTWGCRIRSVWFRRRSGLMVACIGDLWDIRREEPQTALEMLEQHDDGRYGGDAQGRWDGEGYWGNVTLETQHEHLEILRPMLENYPAVPDGFDGWWRF